MEEEIVEIDEAGNEVAASGSGDGASAVDDNGVWGDDGGDSGSGGLAGAADGGEAGADQGAEEVEGY